jgi:undecaprenyl-diphosphatase
VQQLLGIQQPIIFDVMLHVGTLIVVVVVFWRNIEKILHAVVKLDFKSDYGRLSLLIILGSIPTAVIGYVFHDLFAASFSSLLAVGVALFVTGIILFASEKKSKKNVKNVTTTDSVLIGIAQAIAIIPGISRSGLTISTALLRGVKKEMATKFSFLLLVPAVIGALIVESKDLTLSTVDWFASGIGMIVAAVVGYFALKLLLRIVLEKKLHLFAYYCWMIGFFLIVINFIG